MELLTQDEYRAIASGLTLPTAAYIDGAYVSEDGPICLERSGASFIGRVRYLEESYVRRVISSLRSLQLRQTDVSADSVRVPS